MTGEIPRVLDSQELGTREALRKVASPQERNARVAFAAEQDIKQDLHVIRVKWVELAAKLTDFIDNERYLALGFTTIQEWLAQPEINISMQKLYAYTQMYREWIVKRQVDAERPGGRGEPLPLRSAGALQEPSAGGLGPPGRHGRAAVLPMLGVRFAGEAQGVMMRWVRQPEHEAQLRPMFEDQGFPEASIPKVFYGFDGDTEVLHALVARDDLGTAGGGAPDWRWRHAARG
jgi:hypothetical protein